MYRLTTAMTASIPAGPLCAICRKLRSRYRGRPEAQDVAQQHPVPPGELEGDRGLDRGLPPVQVAEAAAHRLLGLWHLQRPSGHRGLTSGVTRPTTGRVEPDHRRSTGATPPRRLAVTAPGTARIAVDLRGGDRAPAVVVAGALRACRAAPTLHLLLLGPVEAAGAVLGALDPADRARVTTQVAGGPPQRPGPPTPPVTHPANAGWIESGVRAAVLAVAQ